jgi:hypothetical protein
MTELLWEVPVNDRDGWTDWVHPLPNYRMQCCDCGLIHEMEFVIADHCKDGVPFNEGEDSTHIIVFRARRASVIDARQSQDGETRLGPKGEGAGPKDIAQ